MEEIRLESHPLFAGTGEDLLAATLAASEILYVAKGGTVYAPNSFRRCLGLLTEGRLEVRREALLVSSLESGDLFGAAALFGGESYPTTLTALEDCTLLLIPQEAVECLLREEGPFARAYAAYLTGRIRFLSGRLDTVSADRGEGKLAHYLLTADGGTGSVTLSATQLCQRLGVGRATLYRAFETLEARGAIAREGKTIRLLSRAELQTCCENPERKM